MKKTIFKILALVIPAIVGISSGILAYNYQNEDTNKSRKFDISIDPQHQDYKELEDNKIQIAYNGKPVHGYSNLHIKLYNCEDRGFSNVPVYMNITPLLGDSIQLINIKVNDSKDAIHPIPGYPKMDKGILKLGYNIDVANYTHDYNGLPILDLNVEAITSRTPMVTATIKYLGLDDTPEFFPIGLSKYMYSFLDTWWGIILFLAALIIIALIIIYPVVRFLNYLKHDKNMLKAKEQYEKRIAKVKEKIDKGELKFITEDIIDYYTDLKWLDDYTATSKLDRWIAYMKPPKIKNP